MNYDYFNQYDDISDKIDLSQLQQQQRRPGREDGRPDIPPGMPPQGPPPGRPPQGPPPGRPPQGPPPGRPPQEQPPSTQFRGRPSFPGRPFPPFVPDFRQIRRCLFQFTYIWLNNGNSFWFYPISIADGFIVGFRWRNYRWDFDTINLRRIDYYQCY